MISPFLALIFSVLGLVRRQSPGMALTGLVVSGGIFLLFIVFPLLMALCR